jgi:hypothetical protein
MLDHPGPAPDLDLLLSPGDEAECLGTVAWRTRCGRVERCTLHLVLHRRHGLWTHLYRIVPDRRPGHFAAFLERAEPGDRRAALRGWIGLHPALAA